MSIQKIATTIAIAFAAAAPLTSSSLGADARIDVSRIIDKTEAESILGEPVKDPTPRNGDGQDGYYSKCNYYANSGKRLVIRVHEPAPNAIGPEKELELIAASSGPVQTVAGLGDKAQMSRSGGDSGVTSRVLMLYIAKGNAFITIGLGGIADETVALEKAKSVAQKILEHL